ncbi:NAD(P)H-dependent flavin oxidoreductase [Aeromicrobium duanguangcaii]|uniref:Nitronate monooxygenase n=1 Tax=Aeromicrobium duanguangcaii TaxID=2968086 RepID=A0ABY5KL07_9ACTN|nr:nitronate monooxygenase [Aeromicrobium duanguangcaii]MCD9153143.1 nitronate monooxygenase [Aeromicrobium duanguangcaii]UUI69756.1 nitronate monooxygenase [Aeromicrobium duanguangcaii]
MHQALNTSVVRRLGARLPIFGFSHSLEVVAAVSRAGGIGIWGATRSTPEEIREGLEWLVEAVGDQPFGIDLVLPKGMPSTDDRAVMESQIPQAHREFVSDLRGKYGVLDDGLPGVRSRFVRSEEMAARQFAEIMASSVPIFAAGVGSPPEKVAEAKAAGKTVISLVGAPKHARYALDAGADILVAQGYEAGAHTGDIGTYALVPQIVEMAGDVPVVVAGGVARGAHIAAALALGGAGVWLGTAWLFTREHDMDPVIFDKLAAAGSADTIRSRADSGKTLRQIKTAWTDEWEGVDAPVPLQMPNQDILVGDFLGSVDRHRVEPLMKSEAGQSVAYFDERTDVETVMKRLEREATDSLERIAP